MTNKIKTGITVAAVVAVVAAGVGANAAYTQEQSQKTKKALATAQVAQDRENDLKLENANVLAWGTKNYNECTKGYAYWQNQNAFARARTKAPVCDATVKN